MLNSREIEKVRQQLETFLAEVRPSPTHRTTQDVSYTLSVDAFLITEHLQCAESLRLVAHHRLKAVHSDDPHGWLIFAINGEGQWAPYPSCVFSATLDSVLNLARETLTPVTATPASDDTSANVA